MSGDEISATKVPAGASGTGNAAALALLGGHSTSFLKAVLDASPDCIKIVELDGSVSFMNENGRCAMEVDDFDLLAGAQWPSLWPQENQDLVHAAVRAAQRGEASRFEAYCPTAKGTPKWWDVSVAPVPGADGQPASIVSISRDVTNRVIRERAISQHEAELERLALAQAASLQEKERLLQEKELLMREIDHRVKNSLALVTSILNVQSRTAPDESVKGALSRAAQRVGLIAGIHERLYKGTLGDLEVGGYLRDLCNDLESSVGDANAVSIRVECPPMTISADVATVLGLVVSELVTNAIRHAFGEGGGGTVSVSLTEEEQKRCLIVHDDGCGLPDGFEPGRATGLGMRVVTAYVRQHRWTLDVSNDGGAKFCIAM